MMSEPKIGISCVANIFSRMMLFEKAGDIEQGHAHRFGHLTLLSKGSLSVKVNDKETIFDAPYMIYIEKDVEHELTALEDGTLAFCIHALRDGNGVDDIIDPESIPNGVSAISIALPTTLDPTSQPNITLNIRRKYFK